MSSATFSLRFKRFHVVTGFVFVAVFLATGVYMAIGIPDINQDDHGMRMMIRSAHVYVLMTALVNLVMGCYLTLCDDRQSRTLQLIGSCLIMSSPVIFVVAFFVEPAVGRLERPISIAGAAAVGIGVVFQAFVMLQKPAATGTDQPTSASRTP